MSLPSAGSATILEEAEVPLWPLAPTSVTPGFLKHEPLEVNVLVEEFVLSELVIFSSLRVLEWVF